MEITLTNIVARMTELGHAVFETGEYNLNLVGLRRMPGTPNAFDDFEVCFYRKAGIWQFHCWPVTTDPGTYWLQNPSRVDGTAILCPGQYRGCWSIGQHHVGQPNAYEALVQGGYTGFKVWRDRDMDGKPTYSGPVHTDVHGLNNHRAGTASTQVDKWSSACQVHAKAANFYEMMALAHRQVDAGMGSRFTYTLLAWT